ncbi:MAG: ABC transporter ATP-binding protein [Flavobacteriales bacterium]|nr:ABC transporter ATP-binding protein [Crocinitomicaceae bacterium]NBX79947.1 ABC transporter ATP-binding protein [Flavobacteriales bacterium]NCA19565.1 ABC transporter ATP-binding protein [Crocinitomicaceae bacterium]
MNYLSVENLTKSFGERVLFTDLTFGIDQGQKVAIIAKNGSGKTTLLRCLMDFEQYDSGRIVFRNDIRVAFMEQTELMNAEQTILEAVFDHDLPELKLIKEYNIAMDNNDEKALEHLYQEITEMNAWDIEVKVQQILSVLKLQDTSQLVGSLSGGQKKRVALAKVLLSEADFLFLDEPTNHLDLDMIEWLESYLATSKSTILMVTHDRYFLEVVCDTIFELADQTIYKYKGNFSYYLEKKAEREDQLQSTIEKAKNTFKKELEWIRRQPKARGVKQKARVDAFQDIKKTALQSTDEDELELLVKMERLGSKIVEFHKVGKNFGEKKILEDFTYNVQRLERLGIVGNNGTGKTTFLKMLLGEEPTDKGKIVIGETVVFGYYSQDLIKVPDDFKVIDVVKEVTEYIPLEKGRQLSAAQLLERFLFSRDMHYNFVHKLSGGEKRRLKLLRVLMSNPNFLILDEPTNDLDIFAMSVLEDYLRNFQGCLIVVSHDRYFMDKMVDHLFVFEGEGKIKDIVGNYTDFRKKQIQDKRDEKSNLAQAQAVVEKQVIAEKKTEVEKRKLNFKEKEEFKKLEKDLETLEADKATIVEQLSSGNLNNKEVYDFGIKLGKIQEEIESKTERWMELAEFA